MSDWNCQIVRIEKVEKHPNADSLDIVTVMGDFPVIVKRDEYAVGDTAIYLSIDTIVPDTELFYFLCPKNTEKYEEDNQLKVRVLGPKYPLGSVPEEKRIIKAKRLRNIYSQGLLLPNIHNMNIGESVVDFLGLKKWEEQEEENIPKIKMGKAAPTPKDFKIPYYDLESVRKYLSYIENEKDIILSEKLNGSNFSCVYHNDDFFVKSRNLYKRTNPQDPLYEEDDMWIDASIRYNLKEKLSKYPDIVLFAECVNQIKNFKYTKENHSKLYFFDAYDLNKNQYLDYDDFHKIINDLELDCVPILYRGPWTNKADMYQYAEGKSTLNEKVVREGWVLSLGKEKYLPQIGGRLKLKLVSESYNLQK